MKVFEGTQSSSTHAPPAPAASTTVTSASSWAATRAASYPAGPPPMITIWVTRPLSTSTVALRPQVGTLMTIWLDKTRTGVFSPGLGAGYGHRRASLRSVRIEPRSRPDAGILPALPHGRHRLAGKLAADLR